MNVERQQGAAYQTEAVRHGAPGEGGTGPGACVEPQAFTASPGHEPCRRTSYSLWFNIKETAVVRRPYARWCGSCALESA
jgi:hypothetical protein